jgi:hypothetical protein
MDWPFYYGAVDRGFAARRRKEPARRGCYPKTAALSSCARGTNLKFQIGDLRGQKAPSVWRLRKYKISRQLGPFYAFLTPFLSHKDLISRRLQRNRRKISQQGASALPPAYTHGGQLKMQNSKLIETMIFFALGAVTIGGQQKSDGGPSHSRTLAQEARRPGDEKAYLGDGLGDFSVFERRYEEGFGSRKIA